jgi:hypothetical protein
MTVITVVSAKASPGATTVALLLAAAGDSPALLIEADSDGGVLGARYGLTDEPGLRTLAVQARRALTLDALHEHAQLVGDIPVVVGPSTHDEAAAVLGTVAEPLAALLGDVDQRVVIDAGRVRCDAPVWRLAVSSALVAMVCRPRLDEFRPAAGLARELESGGGRVGLVCVGSRPYAPSEFASEAGVQLLGVLPDDPRAAAAFAGEPASRRVVDRSQLWLAATQFAVNVDSAADRSLVSARR